jgi:hypothetical protein
VDGAASSAPSRAVRANVCTAMCTAINSQPARHMWHSSTRLLFPLVLIYFKRHLGPARRHAYFHDSFRHSGVSFEEFTRLQQSGLP